MYSQEALVCYVREPVSIFGEEIRKADTHDIQFGAPVAQAELQALEKHIPNNVVISMSEEVDAEKDQITWKKTQEKALVPVNAVYKRLAIRLQNTKTKEFYVGPPGTSDRYSIHVTFTSTNGHITDLTQNAKRSDFYRWNEGTGKDERVDLTKEKKNVDLSKVFFAVWKVSFSVDGTLEVNVKHSDRTILLRRVAVTAVRPSVSNWNLTSEEGYHVRLGSYLPYFICELKDGGDNTLVDFTGDLMFQVRCASNEGADGVSLCDVCLLVCATLG